MPKLNYESKKFESYEDAAAALFMDLYAQSIRLPDAEALQSENSAQFQSRCNKLFRKYQNHQNGRKLIKGTGRFLKGVAVLVIAALSLGSALFMTVEAVREPIVRFYAKQQDGHMEISVNKDALDYTSPYQDAPIKSFNEQDPLGFLLPDDYALDSVTGTIAYGYYSLYRTIDGENYTAFDCLPSESILNINTENCNVTEFEISGEKAILSENQTNTSVVLVWHNARLNKMLQLTTTDLSKEELILMAEALNNAINQ